MNYILILLFSTASVSTPITSIQTEFRDFQACEEARKHIAASIITTSRALDDGRILSRLISQGCYKR